MTKACSELATFGRMVDCRIEERDVEGDACAESEETNTKAEGSVEREARYEESA